MSLAGVAAFLDLDDERYAWRVYGACRARPDLTWFPHPTDPDAEQKAVCATCPVQEICLEVALVNGEEHGIWGGLSERERRRLRRERNTTTKETTP